jgi:aspartate aminotransferase
MNDTPKLSRRAAAMPASPIRRLAGLAGETRRRGIAIHPLNIGQPDIPAPPELLARLSEWSDGNVPYGPSEGLPELIDAIVSYHRASRHDVDRRDVFVTTGGSEALLFVLAALCDDGDDVVVFEPFYTNYSGFGRLVGVSMSPVTTRTEDGYHLPSRAAIEAAVGPRTRAIVLCSPNNPTGTVYTPEEIDLVASIAHDRGLFLVADEVYREFVYDDRRHRSVLELDGMRERIVVVDSLSKRVSLCGARVGWIVTKHRPLLDAVLRMGQARLCPPTLGQYVGAALASVPPSYVAGVVAEYHRRRDVVYEALDGMDGVTVRRPEGAFYVCAKLPIDDSQRFAEFLLSDFSVDGETVMVAPGDGFYATPGLGRQEVRIAYVVGCDRLGRAMRILDRALHAYRGS